MAGYPTCEKCIHGSYCKSLEDWQCFYILDKRHSRDSTRDKDGKCADYVKRKAQKKPKNIAFSPNATPIREKAV